MTNITEMGINYLQKQLNKAITAACITFCFVIKNTCPLVGAADIRIIFALFFNLLIQTDMETCDLLCEAFCGINWMWYTIAVVVAFGAGAIWHTFLFAKTWARVFKVDMTEKPDTANIVITMLMQVLATALFGLVFFVLTILSPWLAVLVLVGFCGWQKGTLKFRYADWKTFVEAACVEAGYTFVTGIIFILFAWI